MVLVMPEFGKQRQEDQGFEDSVDYSKNSSTVQATRDFTQKPTNKQQQQKMGINQQSVN